jgi:hypothetical protein
LNPTGGEKPTAIRLYPPFSTIYEFLMY